jgi:hypothetical protein
MVGGAVNAGWRTLAIIVVGTAWVAPVWAAEAFVCGPQEIIYVERQDLEHMKRTHPCIASHYGLMISDQPDLSQPAGFDQGRGPEQGQLPALVLRQLNDTPSLKPRGHVMAERHAARSAPPVAAPGTDYRNVRVINASSPEDAWFRHGR